MHFQLKYDTFSIALIFLIKFSAKLVSSAPKTGKPFFLKQLETEGCFARAKLWPSKGSNSKNNSKLKPDTKYWLGLKNVCD